MATDLTKLKCSDCQRAIYGIWGQYYCSNTYLPVGLDFGACISVLPKDKPGESGKV